MLWLPRPSYRTISNAGIVGATVGGTACPAGGTTLTDGAVTELISAANNTQDSWGIAIYINGTGASATASEAALDILIGGATDDVLIDALICGYSRADGAGGVNYFFPVHVPAGVRLAGRFASVRTGISASVSVTLFGGGFPPFPIGRKVTTYGTQVNNARGQAVVPAASGAAATVTEMTASTTEAHFAFLPGFQAETDTTLSLQGHINIGIGVGSNPPDRIGTWIYNKDSGEGMIGPIPCFPAFETVPAGSRLSMLASNFAANDAAYGGLVYAVS